MPREFTQLDHDTIGILDEMIYDIEDELEEVEEDKAPGSNDPWHPEQQWLLQAFDEDVGEEHTFAMKDIHSWSPAEEMKDA